MASDFRWLVFVLMLDSDFFFFLELKVDVFSLTIE